MEAVVLIVLIVLGALMYAVLGTAFLFGRTREQKEQLEEFQERLSLLEREIRTHNGPSVQPGTAEPVAESPPFPPGVPAVYEEPDAIDVAVADAVAAETAVPSVAATETVAPGAAVIETIAAEATTTEAAKAGAEKSEPALWNSLKNFIRGGNLWVSGGVVLIFIALALLFTYMARRGYITVEMRITGAALLGLVMTVCGWIFRKKRPLYFLVLQGGGIGILYLCVYAASRLLPYVTPPLTLILMSLLLPPAIVLALLQSSQPLALFGFLGGFAAPLLLNAETGSHIVLFSYYAVLDLAVFVIVFFTFWRGLSCLAFLATFVSASVWVFASYRNELFMTVEPFICFYFILFTLMGLGTGGRKGFSLKRYLDIPVAAGTPLAVLLLHWRILRGISGGYAWSCIAFGALYLLLSVIVRKRRGEGMRLLSEAYLASSVFLANLAIPLELTARLTMTLWAGEGALLYYLGVRLRDRRVKAAGLIVYAASIIAFLCEDRAAAGAFLRNPGFLGPLIIALAALVMALSDPAPGTAVPDKVQDNETNYFKTGKGSEAAPSFWDLVPRVLIPWGLVWWFAAWGLEMYRSVSDPAPAFFILASASALVFFFAGRVFSAPLLFLGVTSAPVIASCSVLGVFFYGLVYAAETDIQSLWNYNFFRGLSGVAWLCFALSQGLLLYLSGRKTRAFPGGPGLRASWTLICLLCFCAALSSSGRAFTESRGLSPSWTSFAGILPVFAFLVVSLSLESKMKGAALSYRKLIFFVFPLVLFCAAGLWFLVTLFLPGDPHPLPFYLPLLNPLELEQAFCIMALVFWRFKFRSFKDIPGPSLRLTVILVDLMVFLWLNAMLWRSVHFLGGLPWRGIGGDDIYRLCLFLLWGIYGIGHIITGNRKASRRLWIAGAALTVCAVLKLLLIDLAETGTLIRIASFFIAGILFLIIGWAAPLPPSAKAAEAKELSGEKEQ
ncbi:MAG: DUF2339 domain-containing protein [Spirochaetaceae bacterium]|jgi:uncharacterized membrane protein|nr:DUF2339 domain-containing protein [Spirochaetaceae bacterium]